MMALGGIMMMSAFTPQPEIYENYDIAAISNNGKWIAAKYADGYSVLIKNLESGEEWFYEAELIGNPTVGYEPLSSYGLGRERCISDDGIVVGTIDDVAAYWENGEWHELPSGSRHGVSYASAITPDGKRIVGFGGTPVVWDRKEDGTYGPAVSLPTPSRDVTGRRPQYTSGISISNDGKTVGAFMRDFLGLLQQPVVIKCDDKGNWTQTLLGTDLLNPNHVEFPPYPGDFNEMMPNYEDYMSVDQRIAWETAHDYWMNNGEIGPEPMAADFMDEDMREAWNKVYIPWYEKYIVWAEKYSKFEQALDNCYSNGVDFLQNNVCISPDGRYLAATRIKEDIVMGMWEPEITVKYAPTLFDTETGDWTLYDYGLNLVVSYLGDNNNLLANVLDPDGIQQRNAYIYPAGKFEPMLIQDFIYETSPTTWAWMEDNMMQTVITGVDDFGLVWEDMICTGIPKATSDLSVIVTAIGTDMWDYAEAAMYSYVFPTGLKSSGVEKVENEEEYGLTVVDNGTLNLTGEFSNIEIFNIAGMKVWGKANASGTQATGLSKGIYIIKGVTASGDEILKKVILP